MKKHLIYWLAAVLIIAVGCQKEFSFEGSNSPAKGSLQADVTGDCLPKTVNGTYIAASALVPATNTITVQVNISKTGTYVVTTDTVNGFYFRATGTFTTLGANNVTLRGNGTPFAAGVNNFVVSFDTTFCDIQVTVLPAGSGPAVFTLAGAPGSCSSANVAGAYAVGVPLAASNTITLNVNVTTAGTYNVTAGPFQGMTFTGTGSLAVGAQTIVLIGTPASIPTTAGANTVPVTAGGTTCSFVVNVVSPAVYTINCPGVMVNGTYQVGTALNASNTITIPITVTTPGPYSISVSTNGMTFAGSGTLTGASTSITLIGSSGPAGPTNAGTFSISVGSPACSIPITCNAAPVINWKFTVVGGATYQGITFSAALNVPAPPFSTFDFEGDNAATDDFIFQLIDLTGGINNNETYNTRSQGLTNVGLDFEFLAGNNSIDLLADPFDTSVGIIFTVQTHNTATRRIIGIFSGTAFDFVSNTIKMITMGTFDITY